MPIDKQQASILEKLDDGVDTLNEPMEETTNTRTPRYDSVGDALKGVATTVGGIASGAVSATLGLPTDIAGLMKGLKDASSAEDGKRLDAFSEGFTEFSKENLGSQYYRDVFDTFVDSLDVDPRLKEDAKSGFSAGEFLGAPVTGGAAVKTVSKIDKIKESLSRAEASASTMKKNARDKIKTFRKEFDNKAPETYTKDEIIAMAAKREPSPVRQMTEADQMISVFPKPERMFPRGEAPKGGDYINPKTGDVLTDRNVSSANIKINPDGKPSFNVSNDNIDNVGTLGKGNYGIKVNLFKRFSQKPKDGTIKADAKGNWKWTKIPEGISPNTETIISVKHNNNHYFTLETDFTKGVSLKKYPNEKSEPRLKPTVIGKIELGQPVGEVNMRGKKRLVYNKIKTFNKGGLMTRA